MRKVTLTEDDIQRFWTKVDTSGDCWVWKGGRSPSGYGMFTVKRRNTRAHRVSYMIAHGPIPDGMCVLHRCDNPPCINPKHLFLGTDLDNVRDRDAKGRTATGERNGFRKHPEIVPRGDSHPFRLNPGLHVRGERAPSAKLKEAQVREIRRLHQETGIGKKKLAQMFGVSKPTITSIIRGKTWQHIQ